MNLNLSLGVVVGASMIMAWTSGARADDREKVRKAIESLGEAANYAWVETAETQSTMPWGGQDGPIVTKGKMAKDGTTSLISEVGGEAVEAVILGDQAAVKTKKGWKSAEELTQPSGGGGGGFGGGQRDPAVSMAWRTRYFTSPQITASDLLEQIKNLKSEKQGVYSGDLDEGAVRSVLLGGRRRGGSGGSSEDSGGMNYEVREALGTAKFWIRDGVIDKIEYFVKTTITSQWGDMDMSRTATVKFKSIGKTKVKISSAAKKVLSKG